ncbi:lipoprotein [Acinetobacter sp.]|uniref:LPS translocon maturation chaperone LptM n=1 Tax=Acinetobacter sp. TaxID=472 RepID=UPI0035B304CE
MRQIICCMSLCAVGFMFTGCGQSGALQLPNDPNYDKRAKYLLYSDAEAPQKAAEQSEEKQSEEKSSAAPVQHAEAPADGQPATQP